MASAPSASALSAVLRCRGNIWKRNPQSTRPAAGVYGGLGMGRSTAPARADLLFRGREEASLGRRRVTLAFKSHQDRAENVRDKTTSDFGKLRYPSVAQSSESARRAVVRGALVCQLARRLLSFVPGWTDTFCGGVVRTISCRSRSFRSSDIAQALGGLPIGALKVSLISPCLASSHWTTLRSACLVLTALVSGVLCSRLALLFGSSSSEPAQLDQKKSEESDKQVDGQTHPSMDFTSTQSNCSTRNRMTRG